MKTIWSNIDLNYEDWKADLDEQYPTLYDDEKYQLMYEINDEYLEDVRINLGRKLPNSIIVIGEIGTWRGTFSGYDIIDSCRISDCLYSNCDYCTWYVDNRGDLRFTGHHHDGTNYYLYRVMKEGLSETQIENFLEKIRKGVCTRRDITRYTRRLGDYISQVYGW